LFHGNGKTEVPVCYCVSIQKLLCKVEIYHINKPCGYRSRIGICYSMALHQITGPIMIYKFCLHPGMV